MNKLEVLDKMVGKADDFFINIGYKIARKSMLFGVAMGGTTMIVGYLMGVHGG
mgnify:CR=1 FL=1